MQGLTDSEFNALIAQKNFQKFLREGWEVETENEDEDEEEGGWDLYGWDGPDEE